MKKTNLILLFSFLLLFVFIGPNDAFGRWIPTLDLDEIDTELNRADAHPHAPYHEIDNGKYGLWINSSTFVIVLDFVGGDGPVSPYTWDDVKWVPDTTMDWPPGE